MAQINVDLIKARATREAAMAAAYPTRPPTTTAAQMAVPSSPTEPSTSSTPSAPGPGPAQRSLEGLKEALERKELAETDLAARQCQLRNYLADAANPALLVDSVSSQLLVLS